MFYTSSNVFCFSFIGSFLILAVYIAFKIRMKKPLQKHDMKKLNNDEIKFMKLYVEGKDIPFTFNDLKKYRKAFKKKIKNDNAEAEKSRAARGKQNIINQQLNYAEKRILLK